MPSVVLASILELFLLLGDLPVNLLLDLSKLKLGPKDLVLLSLEGTLGLLKGGLELLLLNLEPPALFVKLVDGAASIAKLVKKILDLVSEILVLTTDHVELLHDLVMGGLEAVHLRAVVPGLGAAGIKLSHQVISLALPLANNLVKVVGTLLSGDSGSMGPLVLHGDLLELGLKTVLGLLGGGDLGVEAVNCLLSLHDAAAKLGLASFQLINASKSLSLILGLPELYLGLGLGESLESIVLLVGLLVNSHLEVLTLGGEHLELGEEGSTVPSLSISKSLGVLQLGGQGDLVLGEVANGILSLLDLS